MVRRWSAALLTAFCGLLVAATKISDGAPVGAAALLGLFLALAFVLSPLAFPRSAGRGSDTGVPGPSVPAPGLSAPTPGLSAPSASGADDRPVVYWRPGCVFCLRLRVRLGSEASRLHWIDIWKDPAAAAAVRAITGGD